MFSPEPLKANPLKTRADAAALLLGMTEPLIGKFSPGRAQVKIGLDSAHFDRKAAWFEGFARPLWGLAPLHAGGGDFAHWDLFREGLINGTDPNHPEYWELTSTHNQRSVEIAALGFALALAPDKLWEGLSARERENVAAWVGHIQKVGMADNNWHFFPVLAGLGLQKVGVAIDIESRDRHLARIDEFYLRDGWYGDGETPFIDHYNGFALQFYGLIYARHAAESDPARSARYIERATAFAQGFQHFFAEDGAALVQGRSLTYRFAMSGFWAGLAYAGVEALPWGRIKGLWARQVRWWMQRPIFHADGALSVGYAWPNYLMSEEYNSPGSPYWAFKAFAPLALPADYPFWTATEEDLDLPQGTVAIGGASTIIDRDAAGHATAIMASPMRTDMRGITDKYGKLAFSTHSGLCVESERWLSMGFCGDNILAFSADSSTYFARSKSSARMGDGFVESRWSPMAGVDVTTLQGFSGGWEIRLHRVEASVPVRAVESGHASPSRFGTRALSKVNDAPGPDDPNALLIALDDGRTSAIMDLTGTRLALGLDCAPNTSLLFLTPACRRSSPN